MNDAWDVFCRQRGRCALTGVELEFDKFIGSKQCKKYRRGSASLDRIDNARGYTINNVQWVHKYVNFMKRELDEAEFTKWCRRVVHHSKKSGQRKVM